IEDALHTMTVGIDDALAAQQVAAVRVDERERVALLAVTGAKPALEVDAPDGVRAIARSKRLRQRHDASSSSTRHCEASSLEDIGDAARARPNTAGVAIGEPRPQLARAPTRPLFRASTMNSSTCGAIARGLLCGRRE